MIYKLSNYLNWAVFVITTIFFTSCRNERYKPSTEESSLVTQLDIYIEQAENEANTKAERVDFASKALNLTNDIGNDSIKNSKYKNIGNVYRKLKLLETFKLVSNDFAALSRKLNDSMGIADAYFNLGFYYYSIEKMDSAYASYSKAEKIYTALKSNLESGKTMLSMAILQKNTGDFVGGEASSIKAIKYFELESDIRYLASAYNNLAQITNEQEQYDLAIDYHKKALEYREKLNNKLYEIGSLNNIGLVYENKHQFKEAIDYYDRALAQDSILKENPGTYARLLDNRAYAKFLSGDSTKFPQQFLIPLQIREKINDNSGIVASNLHLAEYYLAMNSFETASKFAKAALEKAMFLKQSRETLESLQFLAVTSNDKDALLYTKSYIKISDSLNRQQRLFEDQFARIRYETDRIEIEKEKVTRQNKNLLTILLLLAASFLLIYIFIQRKLNRKELRFRQSQQEANEEIYNLMLAQQFKLEEGKQIGKQRISEELHDGILGRLFGTRLSLDSLNSKNDDASIQTRFKYINELKSIEQEIRQISHDLNSSVFNPDDLFVEVIEDLISKNCNDNSLKYQFNSDKEINWDEIPNAKKVHFYRIIQEGLQNIHKHAKAKFVKISFRKEEDAILLEIEDDGKGMSNIGLQKGIGLKNIASRSKQLNGAFSLISKKGKGTTILIKANF
jgi:signal transduction histidine kinase